MDGTIGVLSTGEVMLWSGAAGALGLVVLLGLADSLYVRSKAPVQALGYLALYWLTVMLLSGLPLALWPRSAAELAAAQVLVGPVCAAMASYGAGEWLSAHQRDRLMKGSLLGVTGICAAGGPLLLLLEPSWRLPASAALSIANLSVVAWLCVRATQLGDRLAWGMAVGCFLSLPAQIGLYRHALGNHLPLAMQAVTALLALASVATVGAMLWQRSRHLRQLRQADRSRRDPITRLFTGVVMVQKIITAQRRRLSTRRDGALMAVLVFEPERLLSQVGQAGLNDIYTELAHRMQRHTGAVNPAGRYYDRCFVVLLETMHSPRWIRTMGLRVAASLRIPIDVTTGDGTQLHITADVAVGIVHMAAAGKDVDQLLDEAQSVAESARAMRSRAAVLDPESGEAVPVESAELGSSWRNMRLIAAAHPRKPAKSTKASRHWHTPA